MGDVRGRQRRGLPARRPALPREGRRRDRDRRRGRRARRLLPAHDARHARATRSAPTGRASARSPPPRPSRSSARWSCAGPAIGPGRSAGMRTLVIGGGIAGQAVVEAIREQDPRRRAHAGLRRAAPPLRPRRALDAAGRRRRPGHASRCARRAGTTTTRIDVRLDTRVTRSTSTTRSSSRRLRPRRPLHRLATRSSRRSPAPSTPRSSAARRTARRSRPSAGPSAPW